jgi:hypothetical protein
VIVVQDVAAFRDPSSAVCTARAYDDVVDPSLAVVGAIIVLLTYRFSIGRTTAV